MQHAFGIFLCCPCPTPPPPLPAPQRREIWSNLFMRHCLEDVNTTQRFLFLFPNLGAVIVTFLLPSLLFLLKRINVTLPFYALVLLSSTLNSCSAIWWIRSLYMHNQKHKNYFIDEALTILGILGTLYFIHLFGQVSFFLFSLSV